MRYAILLSLVGTITACGSELEWDHIDIAPQFSSGTREFFQRCKGTSYQNHCKYALSTLKEIKWKHLGDNLLGMNTHRRVWVRRSNTVLDKMTPSYRMVQYIHIDPTVKEYKDILFHELGHSVGQDHDDDSCLMTEYVTVESKTKAKENWDLCVEELFTKPKDRPMFRERTGL